MVSQQQVAGHTEFSPERRFSWNEARRVMVGHSVGKEEDGQTRIPIPLSFSELLFDLSGLPLRLLLQKRGVCRAHPRSIATPSAGGTRCVTAAGLRLSL